jgi:hypothetical protein
MRLVRRPRQPITSSSQIYFKNTCEVFSKLFSDYLLKAIYLVGVDAEPDAIKSRYVISL